MPGAPEGPVPPPMPESPPASTPPVDVGNPAAAPEAASDPSLAGESNPDASVGSPPPVTEPGTTQPGTPATEAPPTGETRTAKEVPQERQDQESETIVTVVTRSDANELNKEFQKLTKSAEQKAFIDKLTPYQRAVLQIDQVRKLEDVGAGWPINVTIEGRQITNITKVDGENFTCTALVTNADGTPALDPDGKPITEQIIRPRNAVVNATILANHDTLLDHFEGPTNLVGQNYLDNLAGTRGELTPEQRTQLNEAIVASARAEGIPTIEDAHELADNVLGEIALPPADAPEAYIQAVDAQNQRRAKGREKMHELLDSKVKNLADPEDIIEVFSAGGVNPDTVQQTATQLAAHTTTLERNVTLRAGKDIVPGTDRTVTKDDLKIWNAQLRQTRAESAACGLAAEVLANDGGFITHVFKNITDGTMPRAQRLKVAAVLRSGDPRAIENYAIPNRNAMSPEQQKKWDALQPEARKIMKGGTILALILALGVGLTAFGAAKRE